MSYLWHHKDLASSSPIALSQLKLMSVSEALNSFNKALFFKIFTFRMIIMTESNSLTCLSMVILQEGAFLFIHVSFPLASENESQ